MAERLFGSGSLPQRLEIAHLCQIGDSVCPGKEADGCDLARTVLPSLCTFSEEAGLVAVHWEYQI